MFSPREAQKDFLYTKMAALILALLVAGFFAVWSFNQGIQYGLIALSPARSVGRILRIDGDRYFENVAFEYKDEHLVRHTGVLRQRKRFALALVAGDDVGVLYFSFRPAVAQLERQLPRQAISFYILACCFFFHILVVTLLLRTLLKIRAHAAQDVYY